MKKGRVSCLQRSDRQPAYLAGKPKTPPRHPAAAITEINESRGFGGDGRERLGF